MKKIILFCGIVLHATFLSADEFQDQYGNGVIHINPTAVTLIIFYDAPDDSSVTHHLTFFNNAWSFGTTLFGFDTIASFNSPVFPAWFKPLFFIPSGEYARIDIAVRDSSGNFFRTILKDDKGRDVWVKKSPDVSFLTWFGFYSQMSSIELLSGDVILFSSPKDKAQRTNYSPMMGEDKRSNLRPLEIQGFWMKVELQFPDADPKMPWRIYTGWIKWRDEKQPLIKYNLMGC